MAKYDEKFKLKVVREALRGACGVEAIASRRGLDYSMVRRWVDSFRQHGRAGLAKKHTRYDARFKQTVLERMRREGLSGRQAAAIFGIRNPGAIGLWQRQYDQGGLGALAPISERRPRMAPKKPTAPKPDEELTRCRVPFTLSLDSETVSLTLYLVTAYYQCSSPDGREEPCQAESGEHEAAIWRFCRRSYKPVPPATLVHSRKKTNASVVRRSPAHVDPAICAHPSSGGGPLQRRFIWMDP